MLNINSESQIFRFHWFSWKTYIQVNFISHFSIRRIDLLSNLDMLIPNSLYMIRHQDGSGSINDEIYYYDMDVEKFQMYVA